MLISGPQCPVSPICREAKTVGDLLTLRAGHTPKQPAMFLKKTPATPNWQEITWSDFDFKARQVAHGLLQAGLKPGDTVAIIGPTQPAWCIYDMGALLAGMVTVGVYPKQSVDQMHYLLDHSDAKIVFVDGANELATLFEAAAELPQLKAIVPWNEMSYRANRERDTRLTSPTHFCGAVLDPEAVRDIQSAIDPDSTAMLVYTSGTTGPPKGAMISHANILAMMPAIDDVLTFYTNDLYLSFLPMAHVTERVLSFYHRINTGVAAAYATSVGNVLNEVQEVKPTIFGSVPRIFEKAYNKVLDQVNKKPAPVQSVFQWARGFAGDRLKVKLNGGMPSFWQDLGYNLAENLLFRKIQNAFGGQVRMMLTGAAPIAPDILHFFWSVGLPIYEAYGMTEATVLTHINPAGSPRLGTVGLPVSSLTQKIAEDGEILLSGNTVFKGYYKNQEATEQTIINGWLHTGDIGIVDESGYLRITDRKKHIIITAGGKNVAPANIERAVKTQSPYISHVHAHGDRRPYISALIAPSPIETLEWGAKQGVISRQTAKQLSDALLANPQARSAELEAAMTTVADHPAFRTLFLDAVRRGNQQLAKVERVRRYQVLGRDFSFEHGELTPTMKLKRKTVEEKHQALFEKIYTDQAAAVDVEH
ncbi:AMP-dependent synthetase/ligase [Acanthopleuribacter pedis]|uniref:Long-chain fatty acid--CoA ligase n=1 Tax=Acanthopleuribacter pedis TaxID=442870 RepID=A0A8J7QCZ9_9BACT|nr:long-chain fatty acid--CoA ligase [Acanthopleuribacter pedis]MBO1321514.1 long-chain fatty acid--CoA ligase [Acanthopleuribacter pedis]